jgi:membrane associated rhomboid family serine protease
MSNEKPTLTYSLMALCVAIFVLEMFAANSYGENFLSLIFNNFGISLQNVLSGRLWVFLTSTFLHASPEHLVLNMIALYIFGKTVEQQEGRKKFLIAFFASSLIADLFVLSSAVMGITPFDVPTIGASAAIFGLMGVAMVAKPLQFIFYPYLIPIPLVLVALVYTLYNIATFVMVLAGETTSDISYVAHIGGLFAGLLLGFREERSKKGLVIILFILILLLTTPFIMVILGFLDNFNYINVIAKLLG